MVYKLSDVGHRKPTCLETILSNLKNLFRTKVAKSTHKSIGERFKSTYKSICERFKSTCKSISERFKSTYKSISERFKSTYKSISERFNQETIVIITGVLKLGCHRNGAVN